MYYLVYLTTNLINNKIYIGTHKTYNLNDGYIGSGTNIRRAIKKYSKDNFKFQVLHFCLTEEDAFNWEKQIVDKSFVIRKDTYNIVIGGLGGDKFTDHPNKEEIRKRCSKPGPLNGMFGRGHTEESRLKMSKTRKGVAKTTPIWNKGKSIDYCAGSNNHLAKKYLIISPEGKEHFIHGTLQQFCDSINVNYMTIRSFIDKGIIPPAKWKNKPQRDNLTKWEIKSLPFDYDMLHAYY
jgi:group I intron endonuclease